MDAKTLISGEADHHQLLMLTACISIYSCVTLTAVLRHARQPTQAAPPEAPSSPARRCLISGLVTPLVNLPPTSHSTLPLPPTLAYPRASIASRDFILGNQTHRKYWNDLPHWLVAKWEARGLCTTQSLPNLTSIRSGHCWNGLYLYNSSLYHINRQRLYNNKKWL